MSKGRRLIQTQNATIGSRERMVRVFRRLFVRTGPERALMRPKIVSGTRMVLMSEYVKSHMVLR